VVLLLALAGGPPSPASPRPVLRLALEAGGTLTWELYVMHRLGLDSAAEAKVQPLRYATKAAAETALRGGEADVKVDDWIFATRARAQGVPVEAVDAFSRAVGGVVVRAGGPIRSLADLRGQRLGVTSLADKGYTILRAVVLAQFGYDPQRASHVLAAAPPLLNQLLERGDVDAIVQYWQYIPSLEMTGKFRELVSTRALLRRIVPGGDVPFLVVVATDGAIREKAAGLRWFLRALREAKGRLAGDSGLWDELLRAGLLGVPDPAVIPALRARYRRGVPGPWTQSTIETLARLTEKLVDVAGPDILGVARLDPAAYTTVLSPR
jgi:NitT/TauT family transport system substrate-binding protein